MFLLAPALLSLSSFASLVPSASPAVPDRAQPAAAPAAEPVAYVWPTDAVVIDPFRPPAHRYGPGNRGLEFATAEDSSFFAAADGQVSFAGQVGGRLHITVQHADGLRTSYSGVKTIAVAKGERVRAGQPIGTTGDRLHVGVRRGDTYLDPAQVFGPRAAEPGPRPTGPGAGLGAGAARLIPTGNDPPPLRLNCCD